VRLWDEPFDDHAGVDDIRGQRSRSSRIRAALSLNVRPVRLS
jgi:hypothetical protein